MSEHFSIRKAVAGDSDFVRDMIGQLSHAVSADKFEEIFLKNLASADVFYFIAESEGKSVGFLSLHVQSLLHHSGKVAEVQELCIDEYHRSKAFGKKLLEHAVQLARNMNCELIELSTNKKRIRAQGFYEREGWVQSHFKYTMELKPLRL